MLLLLLLLLSSTSALPDPDLPPLLSKCQNLNLTACNTPKCLFDQGLSLATLAHLPCHSSADCLVSETDMRCVLYPDPNDNNELDRVKGFCECPHYTAFDVGACKCARAASCQHQTFDMCHNGMMCFDRKDDDDLKADNDEEERSVGRCGCGDLRRSLYEPQSRTCVLPWSEEGEVSSPPSSRLLLLLVAALALLLLLTLLGLLILFGSGCRRHEGEYECDEPKKTEPEQHVAAWNLPSLDYLSEEQTMKYLKTRHNYPMTEMSDEMSSSNDSTSLPESERNNRYDNRAFVQDHH